MCMYIIHCTHTSQLCFFYSSDIYKQKNVLQNFGQLLRNLFLPLLEATIDPSLHPNLSVFLNQVPSTITLSPPFFSFLSFFLPHAHTQ